jgi:hypothetical protein
MYFCNVKIEKKKHDASQGIIGKQNNSNPLRKMGQCDSVYSSQANDFCRKYTYDMLEEKPRIRKVF